MREKPKVTVIIPNYNGRKFMDQCMDALERQTYTDFVVLIVDNGSTDGSVEYLRGLTADSSFAKEGHPDVKEEHPDAIEEYPEAIDCEAVHKRKYSYPIRTILLRENTGFSGAVNVGISAADTDYVVLLNNDTEAQPDYLRALVAAMEGRDSVFAVSPKMVQLYHQDLLDDAGDGYNILGWAFQRGVGQPVTTPKFLQKTEVFSACAGAAIYRRELLEEIRLDRIRKIGDSSKKLATAETSGQIQPEAGASSQKKLDTAVLFYEDLEGHSWPVYPYFDPLHFAYLEDLDVCFRARVRGYRVFYEPASIVYHVGSGTSGSKYNHFKVRLAARNNVYLNYKNMPLLMLLLNLPGILLGVIIKQIFFIRRGFGKDYAGGFLEGIRTLGQLRPHKTSFVMGRFMNYCMIELKLITDTASYIQDFAVRQMRKLLKQLPQD